MNTPLKTILLVGTSALATVALAAFLMKDGHDNSHDHGDHAMSGNPEGVHDQAHGTFIDTKNLTRTDFGNIALMGVSVRATLPNAPVGGGYVILQNNGDTDDRLISVEMPMAAKSEIHDMSMTDGVMQMRPLKDGIEIPAGHSVVLQPGGKHLMFMGLSGQLEKGQSVPVTLNFENAGSTTLDFPILDANDIFKMEGQSDG